MNACQSASQMLRQIGMRFRWCTQGNEAVDILKKMGMNAHLAKPIDIDELVETLAEIA